MSQHTPSLQNPVAHSSAPVQVSPWLRPPVTQQPLTQLWLPLQPPPSPAVQGVWHRQQSPNVSNV